MRLSDIDVLIVDCQAAGATPAHGDLLELGWALANAAGLRESAQAFWITRQTDRPIPGPIRKLTGFDESLLAGAIPADVAWQRLLALASREAFPTVIHWARFELPFLKQLSGDAPLPLDVLCLHAIAARLFPDLPRRSIRAIAGYLGFSPDLVRRAGGHVEATAFVWSALVPKLAVIGVRDWSALRAWLSEPNPPVPRVAGAPRKRVFAFDSEKRRALSGKPGVYRFLRSNGDVLYVGKAANLRRRVTSHFTAGDTERALEMLTQAHDVAVTETTTALEAALLECDEIKRLDPPYNLQLKALDREAWFANRAFDDARPRADAEYCIGPLPSTGAVMALGAIRKLALGAAHTKELAATSLGVPLAFAPDLAMWSEVFAEFDPGPDVLAAARAAWPPREEERAPDEEEFVWTKPRIRRALDRSLVGGGLLVRRARWLRLLARAHVEFVEPGAATSVALPPTFAREDRATATFDAARYDRVRVLSTELRRVLLGGGKVAVTIERHRVDAAKIYALL